MTSGNDKSQAESEAPEQNSLVRAILVSVGVVSVVLGTAGIFIPLLPTTPFLLLAGACFARSSGRMYHWLINHRWFGTYIRNYREHRAITLPTKIIAITLLWSTMAYTNLVVLTSWALRVPLLVIAAGVTIHLLTLKTFRPRRDGVCEDSDRPDASRTTGKDQDPGVEAEPA